MFLDFIAKLFFPHQPDWERKRNAKIMASVVIVSVILGLLLVLLLKLMNAKR